MNAMGHNTANFIGVNQRDLTAAIRRLVPDYHPMGSAGMAEMGSMEMAMPDNTLPMMTGFEQFGPIEMGGKPDLPPRPENSAPDKSVVERATVKPGGKRTTMPRR